MAFAPLSDLPLGRAHCAICVRVVRLWDYCGNKEGEPPLHVDMVLVDDKENRMYAEIPGGEAHRFRELISEGRIYSLRKFVVSVSKIAYKPFPSTQMIRFTPWTIVEERTEPVDGFPRHVFNLVDFNEFPSRVGHVEHFIDTIGIISRVFEVAHVHLPSSQTSTAKRVISLKDLRNNKINLVLWGSRASDFDAEVIHSVGQEATVVAIFVGMLLKSYKAETTLSGGSACKWYINEEIREIEEFFDRMPAVHTKIEWISAGEQQFRPLEQQKNLEEKTILQLRDMDPWDFEGSGYRCTVTISRINNRQLWWFSSCVKCHRAATPDGDRYKCSGGCPSTTAEPKYRLSLVGTDGTASAEFTLFGRVAGQIIGKPVVSLIRSSSKNQHGSSGTELDHILPEIAALVSQKFTFSVSISQKNLTQRNVSFQVNSIVTFFGKQNHIPTPNGLNSECYSGASTVVEPTSFRCDTSDAAKQLKKPRLERKIIPCKRSLNFDGNGADGAEAATVVQKSAAGAGAGEENLNSDLPGTSGAPFNNTTNSDSTIGAEDNGDGDQNPAVVQTSSKHRSANGRKKAAV